MCNDEIQSKNSHDAVNLFRTGGGFDQSLVESSSTTIDNRP